MSDMVANPPARAPIPEPLLTLAPARLRNFRALRYSGDDLYVKVDSLAPRDQQLIRKLYDSLSKLLFIIANTSKDNAELWQGIRSWVNQQNLDRIIDDAREIGLDSHAQNPSEPLAKAMHDVRGGALGALLGRLQLIEFLSPTEEFLNALFVLTRDHLKIMRNTLVELDEPRRNADRTPKAHAMQLMLDKWHESVVGPQWRTRSIQMFIDCRYVGPLTECCLESAAIDRIFYNLAANASRYAADARLEMTVFPVSESPDECLRFVLSNEVSAKEVESLREFVRQSGVHEEAETRQDLSVLFEPEISSTGSGFGLTVVADFVAGAFGLPNRREALRERYVGAVLDGRTFRAWFHWPMANGDLPAKLDDYHRPQESLSEP